MKITKRIRTLALALVLTLTTLAGCGTADTDVSGSSSSGDTSQEQGMDLLGVTDPYLAVAGLAGDTVVATLGGSDITADELLYWLQRTAASHLNQLGGYITEIPWDTEVAEGVTVGDQLLESALDTAACYRAFQIMGAREGFTPDSSIPDTARQEFEQMVEQLGSEAVVDHMLWAQLVTQDLLISLNQASDLYAQLEELYYGEGSDGYLTDADVMAWLDGEGYFRVKHILLSTIDLDTQEPLDEDAAAQKRATADDLLAQLQAADDPITLFDSLMQEYSEDGGLAAYPEGYIFNAQDSLVGGFREAALALEVGDLSGIVETDYGYHIMLRLPINPADYRDTVVAVRMQEKVEQWLDELGLEKTDAYGQIDPASVWEKLTALKVTARQEIAAAQDQGDPSASSQSGSQG